jgi:hypothetical protein
MVGSPFGVHKTKIGDDRHGNQRYPQLSLIQKAPGRMGFRLGMKKAKPGMFAGSGPKGEGFAQDHRAMHSADGIT